MGDHPPSSYLTRLTIRPHPSFLYFASVFPHPFRVYTEVDCFPFFQQASSPSSWSPLSPFSSPFGQLRRLRIFRQHSSRCFPRKTSRVTSHLCVSSLKFWPLLISVPCRSFVYIFFFLSLFFSLVQFRVCLFLLFGTFGNRVCCPTVLPSRFCFFLFLASEFDVPFFSFFPTDRPSNFRPSTFLKYVILCSPFFFLPILKLVSGHYCPPASRSDVVVDQSGPFCVLKWLSHFLFPYQGRSFQPLSW